MRAWSDGYGHDLLYGVGSRMMLGDYVMMKTESLDLRCLCSPLRRLSGTRPARFSTGSTGSTPTTGAGRTVEGSGFGMEAPVFALFSRNTCTGENTFGT